MTEKQIRDAEAWARKQKREVIFEFPDRQPGEATANAAQRRTVRSLFPNLDETELSKLGEFQAENVIAQMRDAQADFNLGKVLEYAFTPPPPPGLVPKPAPSSASDFMLALFIMVIGVLIMGRLITGSWGGIFGELFGR